MLRRAVTVILFMLSSNICFADRGADFDFTDDDLRKSSGEVVYVTMLFRHGDRTPIKTYPTDPYPLSIWKEGTGQLTKIGKLHEYELGKWTRQQYKNLAKPYRYDLILVNSSDSDRTLMSAEAFLAGLFPPGNEELWNKDNLRWQPIPVHTLPKTLDNIIALERPCERYDLDEDLLNNSPEFDAFFEEHRGLFEYTSTHSGIEMTKNDIRQAVDDLSNIHDSLFIEDQNNMTLPEWAQKIYPQPLRSVARFFFSTLAYTDEMRRLKGGPLLKSIVDDLVLKAANELGNRTFHIYSGHDTTIAVLLDTLNVFNRIAPPYSAAVIIELRQKNDDYFVTVSYRNSSQAAPFLLHIPGCKNKVCTLEEFIQVTSLVIPENWEFECELGILTKLYYYTYFDLVVLGVIILALITLLIVICKLHYMRTQRYIHYQTIKEDLLHYEVKTCD